MRPQGDGTASWLMARSVKEIPYPWGNCNRDNFSDAIILHQIRHPLKVISSLQTIHEASWRFIADHIDIRGLSEIERRMTLWLKWNELCSKQANLTYKVEAINESLPKIAGILNIPAPTTIRHVGTKVNARPHDNITWDDLYKVNQNLCEQIKYVMKQYGYTI